MGRSPTFNSLIVGAMIIKIELKNLPVYEAYKRPILIIAESTHHCNIQVMTSSYLVGSRYHHHINPI